MDKIRLMMGVILSAFLFAILILFSNSVMAAPGIAPLLDDPTPTPCVMSGDLNFELDPFGADQWSASHTYDGIVVDASGSTGQFDVIITFDADSNRDWFGGPDPIASDVLFRVYSGSSQTGDQPKSVAAGSSSDNVVTIHHETIRADDDLKISFTMQAPAVSAHSSVTITSIEFDGLITEMPCEGCLEKSPDDLDAVKTATLLGTDEVGHLIDLTEGETYLLYTMPGPWNDGTDDRKDAAIRFFDGAAWGSFTEISAYENEAAVTEPPCDDSFLESGYTALAFTATEDMQQMQIRVNDADDEFEDNSKYLNYVFSADTGGYGQSCLGNWTKGDLVGSVTVDATDSSFQYLTGSDAYMTEGLYGLVVDGSYTDNGVASSDILMADYPSFFAQHNNWTDGNFLLGTETCDAVVDDTMEYYGSARLDFYDLDYTYDFGEAIPLSKVDDGDSNYANNSGTIDVSVYEAGYTAPVSDCSTKYDTGTWWESGVIFADNEDGAAVPQEQTIGLVPGQTYYIEPAGAPYQLNGSASWDFEIKGAYTDAWADPEVFADCYTQLDENRYGYYFTAPAQQVYMRAEHSLFGYAENSGSFKYNLYAATPYEVPDGESCSDYVDLDTLIYKDNVSASSTSGFSIDYSVFDPGSEYAIKVVGPAYNDPGGTGKTGEIRRAAPGVGSVDYQAFEDWPGAICYEQNSGYDAVYFKAADVSDYEVRATDPSGSTGTFYFEVWGLDRVADPVASCEVNDYGDVDYWSVIKEQGIVEANNDGTVNPEVMAVDFSNVEDGVRYKMEIDYIDLGRPMTAQEMLTSGSYVLQISDDGGATWVFLEDWVDCWVDLDGPTARGYFTAPVSGSGPYLLRVYDSGGDWAGNEGGLQYKLWISDISADPGDVGSFYETVTKNWSEGCYATCVSPAWTEFGQWVEFARCKFSSWLAWCPWHAEAIDDMKEEIYSIGPVGTMMDLVGLGVAIRDEINNYEWSDAGGGGDDLAIEAPQHYLFMPEEGGGADIPLANSGNSIWGGGEVSFELSGLSYSTECDNTLADYLGSGLAQSACFGFNVIDKLGLNTWVNLLWNVAMVGLFIRYVIRRWVNPNT